MPYIGNTIRAADDYRLIDDISSSFNGSTTSFALQVAGSAPVPFPKSPQQVLISVNGVIQEPDPTGASGFNLVGTNIVFSSAPTNGHAFFGIIYATADYLNAGGNFPSGSLGAPSFTFIGDENTGLYRKSGGSVGFVSDATEIANFDSNGITISSGGLILGDSSGAGDDRIKLGASGDLEIYHDGSHSRIVDVGTGGLKIQTNALAIDNAAGTETMAAFTEDGSVQLRHNNSTKIETAGHGINITGGFIATGNSLVNDNGKIQLGSGSDLQLFHDGSNSFITNISTGGFLHIRSGSGINLQDNTGDENFLKCIDNGAVELYHDNSKKFQTTSTGVDILGSDTTGSNLNGDLIINNASGTRYAVFDASHTKLNFSDNASITLGTSNDLQILHDGNSRIKHVGAGVFSIQGDDVRIHNNDANEFLAKFVQGGAAELYFNNSKKFETLSDGVNVTGTLKVNGSTFSSGLSNIVEDTSPQLGGTLDTNGQLISFGDSTGSTVNRLNFGAGNDLNIYHEGNHSYIRDSGTGSLILVGSAVVMQNGAQTENMFAATENSSVALYFDNVKKAETFGSGLKITSGGELYIDGNAASGHCQLIMTRSDQSYMISNETFLRFYIGSGNTGNPGTLMAEFTNSGHFRPGANNTFDLGDSGRRWRNVFTMDLNLSNKGSQNDVDSTWGDYTIQEGYENLFLINNRTGKKFKFNLTEVS